MAGTVRTVYDRSVKVMLLGRPPVVKQVRRDLEPGPRFARVDGIAEIPCSFDPDTVVLSIL